MRNSTKIWKLLKNPWNIPIWFLIKLPYFRFLHELSNSAEPISFNTWFKQKIMGCNKDAYWPMHSTSVAVGVKNIYLGVGTNPGLNHGCYIQGNGELVIGNYCIFGPGVGLLSGNHNLYDNRVNETECKTVVGNYCWIGMNSIILPGVVLGDFTVVGAGSVVTKSFQDGYCVLAGNPAKVVKKLEKESCVKYENTHLYHGYLSIDQYNLLKIQNENG